MVRTLHRSPKFILLAHAKIVSFMVSNFQSQLSSFEAKAYYRRGSPHSYPRITRHFPKGTTKLVQDRFELATRRPKTSLLASWEFTHAYPFYLLLSILKLMVVLKKRLVLHVPISRVLLLVCCDFCRIEPTISEASRVR
ncbi:hypothetical protein Tco_0878119 [Tanacetum coccineum]|uniref:Uncharacterized protein n=1 Tax=Tanacetum coccineum TaxID=301880 RepID=A0ABQ5C0G0_9ASTR